MATGCMDGKVWVWDSLSGDCVRTFSGHSDEIQSLSTSASMDFLDSVSFDGTARVFEIVSECESRADSSLICHIYITENVKDVQKLSRFILINCICNVRKMPSIVM